MNNLFRNIASVVSALATVCLVSCQKDTTTTAGGKDTTYFPIGKNIDIHPLGDTLNVSFTCDEDWYVEVIPNDHNWLHLSLKESKQNLNEKGTANFTISAKAYEGVRNDEDNEATVTFYTKSGKELHSVQVSQPAAYIEIVKTEGTDGDFEWYAEGDIMSRTYMITSNIHWVCDFMTDDIFLTTVNEGGNLKGESKYLTVKAKDINMDDKPHPATLVFRALKKNGDEETVMNSRFTELDLQQDNLVFKPSSNEFDPIGELGNYSFSDTDKAQYYDGEYFAYIEVLTETDYDIQWRMENESDFKEYVYGDTWFQLSSEDIVETGDVLAKRFIAKVSEANPSEDQRAAIIRLVSNKNARAYNDIRLVQDGYTWNVSIEGGLSADISASTTITVDTKGPWQINPEVKDWWVAETGTKWSGEGYAEIKINSAKWNLLTDEDLSALFEVSSGLNDLDDDITLTKERFHFKIGKNIITGKEVRDILADLRKKDNAPYEVGVDCSGEWVCRFEDAAGLDSTWVNISAKQGKGENQSINLGAMSKNSSSFDREAKVIFTSLTHREHGEVLTETLSLKQLKHTFGWGVDDWTEEQITVNTNQPAYIGEGTTFGIPTIFSDDWSLESDASWVKFNMKDQKPSSKISGDGVSNGDNDDETYVWVTVDNNFSTDNVARTATVTVRDEFKGEEKSFKITQEPFVFQIDSEASYPVGPFETDNKSFSYRITQNAPWTVQVISGDESLLNIYTKKGTGTGNIETYTFAAASVPGVNTSDRTATVKMAVTGSTLSKTFTLSQPGYPFEAGTSTSEFPEVDYEEAKIKIDCYNNDWKVNSKPSWIKAEKDGDYVKLTPTAINDDLESDNTGDVVISTPFGGNEQTLKISVKQDKYKFSADKTSLTFETLEDDNDKQEVKITASADWDVDDDDLDSFNASKKITGNIIEVSVDGDNYQMEDISEEFSVISEHKHQVKISVTQKAYVFSVNNFVDTTVDNKAQTISFNDLKCSGKLEAVVETTAKWIKVKTQPENGTLALSVEANDAKDAKDRSAKITVSSEHVRNNNKLTKEITITQTK